jgi:CRP-like cAMP-binding protein
LNTPGLHPVPKKIVKLPGSSVLKQPSTETNGDEAFVARAKKKTRPFNVKSFLSTVDGGRSVRSYRKNEPIFSQGDPANAVFYIQKGGVKVCVTSESRETDGRLILRWTAMGGPTVRPPTRQGFGARVIERATNQLKRRTTGVRKDSCSKSPYRREIKFTASALRPAWAAARAVDAFCR